MNHQPSTAGTARSLHRPLGRACLVACLTLVTASSARAQDVPPPPEDPAAPRAQRDAREEVVPAPPATASPPEGEAAEDLDEPASGGTTVLHLDMIGEPPDGITLRRGPGEEPISACAPPCSMSLDRGHYRVRLEGADVSTAFHLDGDEHRIAILHEDHQDVRDLAFLPGTFFSASFATFLVFSLVGGLIQEAGGGASEELMYGVLLGGAGMVVFGIPTFAFSAYGDGWTLEAR